VIQNAEDWEFFAISAEFESLSNANRELDCLDRRPVSVD